MLDRGALGYSCSPFSTVFHFMTSFRLPHFQLQPDGLGVWVGACVCCKLSENCKRGCACNVHLLRAAYEIACMHLSVSQTQTVSSRGPPALTTCISRPTGPATFEQFFF